MRFRTLISFVCLCSLGVAVYAAPATKPATKPADKTASKPADKASANPADKLVFRNNGFSIAPLDEPGKGAVQVLMMCLPAMEGFQPNVNVVVQPFGGTLDDYVTISKKQFQQANFKVISEEKKDKNTHVFEYSGQVQGKAIHWYARAALRSGTMYLATGTCTEEQWKDTSPKLKACVDSLETATDAKPGK